MNQTAVEAGTVTEKLRYPGAGRAGGLAFWIRAALLMAPIALMYYDSFLRLAGDWWNDPNNSHGLLIPPLVLYFLWRRWQRILAVPVEPRFAAGLAAVLGTLGIFFVGRLGAEFFLTRVSFVFLLAALTLYFWGFARLKEIAFPLFLLALSVPIPQLIFNTVSLPLQSVASIWSSGVLQICGVPVLREGNVMHLSNASLGVAEACSGLRSLVSLLALSIIVAYIRWRGWPQRAVLVASSIPLAVALNIVRISVTGLMAEYWDPRYAMGFFHLFSGWIVFVAAFAILFSISAMIQRWFPSPPPDAGIV